MTEFGEIQQALRDLHELYPEWEFTARHPPGQSTYVVPAPDEAAVRHLATAMDTVHEALKGNLKWTLPVIDGKQGRAV